MAQIPLLFLDIETFYEVPWLELTEQKREAFINHHYKEDDDLYSEEDIPQLLSVYPRMTETELVKALPELNMKQQYEKKAGLLPEFGRIICCSVGMENTLGEYKAKCFKGPDEGKILETLDTLVSGLNEYGYGIAGWNTNGFDIPFIAKRYILKDMFVPAMFNTYGSKPWERKDVDVMQVWKCGSWSNVSLEVACAALNIPVKFTEHTGKNIWEQTLDTIDWDELQLYCDNDTYSSYLVYKKLQAAGYC